LSSSVERSASALSSNPHATSAVPLLDPADGLTTGIVGDPVSREVGSETPAASVSPAEAGVDWEGAGV